MATLFCQAEGMTYPLAVGEKKTVLGRSKNNDIVLKDTRSSRHHCHIWCKDNIYWIKDLKSRNGTLVNEQKVLMKELCEGDKIRVGDSCFIFSFKDQPPEGFDPLPPMEKKFYIKVRSRDGNTFIHSINQKVVSIGRGAKSDVRLKDDQVSSRHADIFFDDGVFKIRDLESRNGTRVNGSRVAQKPLNHGDTIEIGKNRIVFECGDMSQESLTPDISETVEERLEASKAERRETRREEKIKTVTSFHKRANIPFAGVVAILLFVAVAGAAFGILINRINSRPKYRPISGNKIIDYSFEQSGYWQLQKGMEIRRDGKAHSGISALCISESNPCFILECTYWERIPVEASSAYNLVGWVQAKGLEGLFGYRLRWFREKEETPFKESTSPFYSKESSVWEKTEAVFTPPQEAKSVSISCILAGRAQEVLVDDIQFIETIRSSQSLYHSLTCGGATLKLRDNGIWDLSYSSSPGLTEGKFSIWSRADIRGDRSERTLLADQSYSTCQVEEKRGSLTWNGKLLSFSGKGYFSLNLSFEEDPDGVRVSIDLSVPKKEDADIAELSFVCPSNLFEHEISVGSDKGFFSAQPMDIQDMIISQMILRKGIELGIFYDQPTATTILMKESLPRLRFEFPILSESHDIFRFKIKTSFIEDTARLNQIMKKAHEAEKESRMGDALAFYNQILKEFPLHQDTEHARTSVTDIMSKGENEIASLEKALEQARFFNLVDYYKESLTLAEKEYAVWKNSRIGDKINEISELIHKELKDLLDEQIKDRINLLLKQASDLEKEGYIALALLFYQELTRLYPNQQEASQAKDKIHLIRQKLELGS